MTSSSFGMRRVLSYAGLTGALALLLACESGSSPGPTTPSGVLQVTLGATTLKAGETTTVQVTAAGTPVAGVTWSSTDATVASVDATGAVLARRAGRAVLTASAGSAVGQASVRVVPDFGGSWTGPIARVQPSCAPGATIAFCRPSPPASSLLAPVTLTVIQRGAAATGTIVDTLEPTLTVTLSGTVDDGDVLTLAGAGTAATTTGATRQVTVTNLRASFDPTLASITGAYTAAATVTGASGASVPDYAFVGQFRDLLRR